MSVTESPVVEAETTAEAHEAVALEPSSDGRTFRDMLDAVLPVVGVVAVAGPPVIALAAPWLLLVLMLSAPFAVLVAFAVVAVVALAALAALAGIVAAPYVLVRHLHRRYRAGQLVVRIPRRLRVGAQRARRADVAGYVGRPA
jgi:sterol desaturase/sphingolipid hydroxylase (fatty acid hydroxylase superfamily)